MDPPLVAVNAWDDVPQSLTTRANEEKGQSEHEGGGEGGRAHSSKLGQSSGGRTARPKSAGRQTSHRKQGRKQWRWRRRKKMFSDESP